MCKNLRSVSDSVEFHIPPRMSDTVSLVVFKRINFLYEFLRKIEAIFESDAKYKSNGPN